MYLFDSPVPLLRRGGPYPIPKPYIPTIGIRDVTALRCSEPLRSKVGRPKRSSPYCAGWDRLTVMEISAYVLYQIIQNANLNELILLHYCSYQSKSKVYHFLYGIPYSSSSCLSKNEDYILPVSDCLLPKA